MTGSNEKGRIGEQIAEKYLTDVLHARILEKNYTVRGGEIDIIADINGVIAFVEVKLRTIGSARGAITMRKRQLLSRAALIYLQRNHLMDRTSRFDAILIQLPESVEYIPRAFDFVKPSRM